MPEFRVLLDQEAERNVAEIYQWIHERSAEGALRWYRAFLKALFVLADEADRFAVAPESHHFEPTIRNLTFRMKSGRAYRVLFTIVDSEVHILFVRGPGQNWVTP
jgi:plasmid stabilization system protein ParE